MIAQKDIDLRWIINVIRRRFKLIAGCAVFLGIVTAAVSFLTPLKYEASLRLMVEPAKDTQSNEFDTLAAAERLALTYSQMMKSTNVARIVIKELGLTIPPESLIKKINVSPIKDTHLIAVSAVESSPQKAASLANALADAFIQYNQEIQMLQYNKTLADNQKTMDDLRSLIDHAQSQIDSLTADRLVKQTALDDLRDNQSEIKSEYRALQKNKHDLEFKLQQLEEHVTIVEPAQPMQDRISPYPNSVVVTMLINPNPIISGNDYSSVLAGEMLAATYGQLLTSRSTVEAALAKTRSQLGFEDVINYIHVEHIPGTLLNELVVGGSDAQNLANAIAEEFILQNKTKYQKSIKDQIAVIETQLQETSVLIGQVESEISTLSSSIVQADAEIARLENLVDSYQSDMRNREDNEESIRLAMTQAANSVILVEPAEIPKEPVQNRFLNIILAGILGSMLGVAIAFFLQYLDNKIHTPDNVLSVLGLNCLGLIGQRDNKIPELLVDEYSRTILAEQFSILSARIRRILVSENQHSLLLVTSPMPSEGKTFVSANLAVAMARAGLRVVLIDADLRRPRIHEIFRVQSSNSMAEMLQNESSGIKLTPTAVNGLMLLAAGKNSDNPTHVLNSPQFKKVLTLLKQNADLTIVDCPPVLSFADAQAFTDLTTGTLLVIRSGKTWIQAAQDATANLEQIGLKVVGVVLNDIPDLSGYSYISSDGYGREKSKSLLNPRPF